MDPLLIGIAICGAVYVARNTPLIVADLKATFLHQYAKQLHYDEDATRRKLFNGIIQWLSRVHTRHMSSPSRVLS